MKDCYPLGEAPPLGQVPRKMLAQVIRQDRFGEPMKGFRAEEIEVPAELRPDEVLVYVMAAGVNYNNVWASLGTPVDVIKGRQKDADYRPFHIGGSDASGIVWKVGTDVKNVRVGDQVVIHCGTWSPDGPVVRAGGDPMFDPTFRIWG
ncbi:MAG TPA: alcohol dehydrogenase catalytic domain-containing protein, partial [Candidatus Binatia bacterium]|nr:alcohol dehydrogenase catalytic domain-containing protein [Candidatus Binatia bacterium]